MNIKITYNWLLEYLDTDTDPYEIQKYLSLCGPSIETVDKVEDDYVFDVEVTSNRVDSASLFGIAQECAAILPQFGKKAVLKRNPLEEYQFSSLDEPSETQDISIELIDSDLAERVSALLLSEASLAESPDLIKKRLVACDERPINNVVDISNYMRIALGQPCHIFDYDAIADSRMIIRKSKKGESIITLDKDNVVLPGDDIVIADGKGSLIDQPGIMGAFNSSVTEKTKNILLFVPNFNGKMVRRTSMLTGKRSNAVAYFEKGLDPQRAEPALVYAAQLLHNNTGAKIASKVVDIYPKKASMKTVSVSGTDIARLMGVDVESNRITKLLEALGFKVAKKADKFSITVPTYRHRDIEIKEDIIEEIARVYGYHNIPSKLQPITDYVRQPQEFEKLFSIQEKTKKFLKHLGLHESMNYSMISQEDVKNIGLDVEGHLKVSNTISKDLQYMRTSLFPSLIKNLKDNEGKRETLRLFEIAKVYIPRQGELPDEIYKVGIAVNTDYFDLKGIVEALLKELNIERFEIKKGNIHVFSPNIQANLISRHTLAGSFGQLKTQFTQNFGLKKPVYLAGIDLKFLMDNYRTVPRYQPINPFATIKLDLTAKIADFASFKKRAMESSQYLQRVELTRQFKDNITVRLYFSSTEKNLTEKEAQSELEKIKKITS